MYLKKKKRRKRRRRRRERRNNYSSILWGKLLWLHKLYSVQIQSWTCHLNAMWYLSLETDSVYLNTLMRKLIWSNCSIIRGMKEHPNLVGWRDGAVVKRTCCFCLVLFWDRVCLYNSHGCPGTCFVDQVSLELTEIYLPLCLSVCLSLPPKCCNISHKPPCPVCTCSFRGPGLDF